MRLSDPAVWAARPWEAVADADLAPALAVPSMLSAEEARLYHWVGREAEGIGAVVDLGAFAGGSAARLLSGLRPGMRLHAFDRFRADPKVQRRFLGGVMEPGDAEADILPLARRLLAPWGEAVTLHQGDIAEASWDGPIEVLAHDAGKTDRVADAIARGFFPALVAGRSVVLHQDFLHAAQPWLAAQAVCLRDCLQAVARVGRDCVALLWTSPATPERLAAARLEGMDDARLLDLIGEAAGWLGPLAGPEPFRAMTEAVRAHPGERRAWRMRR